MVKTQNSAEKKEFFYRFLVNEPTIIEEKEHKVILFY
tara:strand:- start:777 stop:887 length:111 start_codon:yes stop_codon:yes gene_type:complete